MKKKFLAVMLCMILLLTGCAGDNTSSADSSSKASDDAPSHTSTTVDVSQQESSNDTTSSEQSQTSSKEEPEPDPEPEDKETHLIMMSDVHLCLLNWYGMTSADRMEKMVNDLNNYMVEDPYSALMILGDLSLDFWENTQYGGSYRRNGYSNTQKLLNDYLANLTCDDRYYLPGNHEQYSNEDWKRITGFDRQYSVMIDGWLFIMLDTFAGELDPNYDHHGKYTGADVAYIKQQMAKHPDAPVVLCGHYFYATSNSETDEFRDLLKNEERIVCLFSGHDHVNTVEKLPASCGYKTIFHCGNFSYTSSSARLTDCPWGWRNVYISDEAIRVDYFTPKSELQTDEGTITIPKRVLQEPVTIPNPMK